MVEHTQLATDHVVLSAGDVAYFDVGDSRHDAVACLVNEDHHSTWPRLTVETQLGVGHKVLPVSVVT